MQASLELLRDIHVLYVEDDDVVRKQYLFIFRKFFEHIYAAKSGQKGIELFEKHPIQLVITDLKMPQMNGLEMLQIIRKMDARVPAFIVSSYSEKEDLLGAVRLQLVDYLIKPLGYNAIKEALSRCATLMFEQNLLHIAIDEHTRYCYASKELRSGTKTSPLPLKEATLLELLLKHRGQLVSREAIEMAVYGFDASMSESALHNLVSKLRKKLPKDQIQTHRNGGYILS